MITGKQKFLAFLFSFLTVFIIQMLTGIVTQWAFQWGYLIEYGLIFLFYKLYRNAFEKNNLKNTPVQNDDLNLTSFSTVSELLENCKIKDMHYTTVFIKGFLLSTDKKYYVCDSLETPENKLEILFNGTAPEIENDTPHEYKGTLMIENGLVLLQWTNLIN